VERRRDEAVNFKIQQSKSKENSKINPQAFNGALAGARGHKAKAGISTTEYAEYTEKRPGSFNRKTQIKDGGLTTDDGCTDFWETAESGKAETNKTGKFAHEWHESHEKGQGKWNQLEKSSGTLMKLTYCREKPGSRRSGVAP
jgi:hypothetical protein